MTLNNGNNDAHYNANSTVWIVSNTVVSVNGSQNETGWLQFISPLARNTNITAATLRLTPANNRATTPITVNYVDLYQLDLSADRSSYLSTLDPATQIIESPGWVTDFEISFDVTDMIDAWHTESEVPEEPDLGAYITIVLDIDSEVVFGGRQFYAVEHSTGAPAELDITYQVS